MQVALALDIDIHSLDALHFGKRGQGADIDDLGLASGEHRGAVHSGKKVDLGGKRTDLSDLPSVRALVILQDHLPHGLLLVLVHGVADQREPLFLVGKCLSAALSELVHSLVPCHLVVGEHGGLHHFLGNDLLHGVHQLLRDDSGNILLLLLADSIADLVDECDQLLVDFMGLIDRVDHDLLRNFLGAGFDHDDLVLHAGYGQCQVRDLLLIVGGVDDELSVHQAHLRHGAGTIEGNVGDRHSDGGSDHGGQFRRAVRIHAHDKVFQRHVISVVLREQRAHGTVDDTVGEDRVLGGLSLALHEAAGDLAHCVLSLVIFHRQREEIDALPGLLAGSCRGKDDRVTVVHQGGAVRLGADSADLNGQGPAGQFHAETLEFLAHSLLFSFSSLSNYSSDYHNTKLRVELLFHPETENL